MTTHANLSRIRRVYIFGRSSVLKNYLIIAWRNIKKSKAYSALNIIGLAVGMAVFILIMLFVRTEISYDRYHANARNIYRIIKEDPGNYYLGSNVFAVTPGPMAPALKSNFPEVRESTRVDTSTNVLLSVDGRYFLEKAFHWTDPQTFTIFSFPIIRGDRAAPLANPFSVLLSERAARKYFGGGDPVNRTIVFHAFEKTFEFKIAGVFQDIPANSHFTMDIVAPFETMAKIHENDITQWGNNSYYTYILLEDGADPRALEAKLPAFIKKFAGDDDRRHGEQPSRFIVQPLTAIHLHSRANFEISPVGDSRFVLLFASIAVLVLVIACVNYMNLAMARSLKRAREVGLRKVVGAARGQLVGQFLGDSLALTFLALLLAVGIVLAALPAFKTLVERDIVFNPFRDLALTPGLLLLAVIVGAAAGGYPAFFVSSFRPVASLKGTGAARSRGKALRNALIVFQFAASITLIVCTAGVRSQLRFIRNTDMGYARDQILVFTARGGLGKNLEPFKTELKRNPAILEAATSSDLPDNVGSSTVAKWPGRPESVRIPIYVLEADYDFVELYGLKIVQGRNFSRDFPSDANGAFLINESARKAIGWDDPIGRDFNRWGNDKPAGKIVGVVKDFHMHSLHLPIMPLYIYLEPRNSFYAARISVKIRGENVPATVAIIRKAWERFAPEFPFEYSFFDEVFNRAYRQERRLGTIFSAFAGLAVFIACLGLLGLASFAAEQKTREIGIRKVLGASLPGIIAGISREFMKWVVLANGVAWPIGYVAMKSWLRNFAYRTSLTAAMFFGAALATFFIAAAVIGFRTYRAAAANPADSLRYE
jgi:putative ABC transport system permease protein